jgi:ferredoxin-NADP reductase
MHKYTVASNEALTPTTSLITLRLNEAERPFAFVPGQYAAINFFKKSRPSAARCFSIVSSPTEAGILQFSMRNGGRYTGALSEVEPGSPVSVRGPYGGFVFDQTRDRTAVFLAGGIGITPFISMIRYLTKLEATNNITLIYSCRTQDDIPFAEELKELCNSNPNFRVVFVIAQGETNTLEGQLVTTGRVSPELINKVVDGEFAQKAFYICGPPPFMKGMTGILRHQGVAESLVMTEAFGQGTTRQTGKIQSWPFNVYAMGAVSMALGSFVVMAADLVKTLPPASALGPSKADTANSPANSRQSDLDKLVNGLTALLSDGPPSEGVTAAQLAAIPKTQAATAATGGQTAAPTRTQPITAAAPAAAAPAPARVPVCKTTPSGVTTCI